MRPRIGQVGCRKNQKMVTGFLWDLEKGVHRSLLEEKWEKDFENCKKKKRKKERKIAAERNA